MTDIKGMHSWFTNNIDQTLIFSDNPIRNAGIHGTYDFLNKEAIFTFLGPKELEITVPTSGLNGSYNGDITQLNNVPDASGFTIAYSESVDAWTSFYSFLPSHYINSQNRLLTPKQEARNYIYRHNIGSYLNFYDTYNPLKIELVVSPYAEQTKIFDNVSFHTLAKTTDGHGLDQTTFERFNCNTEYQHSGPILLLPEVNLKKEEREWKLAIPRNIVTESNSDINIFDSNNYDSNKGYFDRLRDKYLIQRFEKDGQSSLDQFVLNYMNTYFRVSAR